MTSTTAAAAVSAAAGGHSSMTPSSSENPQMTRLRTATTAPAASSATSVLPLRREASPPGLASMLASVKFRSPVNVKSARGRRLSCVSALLCPPA